MVVIHLDFETYSEAKLKDVGAWQYSRHGSTEVLCLAYAVGRNEPKLWIPGDHVPKFNIEISELHAWNSFFEYCIWHNVLKWEPIPVEHWVDTMAASAASALPLKLEKCGEALRLPKNKEKSKRGKNLIQKLCKPNNKGIRNRDPELLGELYDYCIQDVISEKEISKRIRPLNELEKQVWQLDQKINLRGVPIDLENVECAVEIASQAIQSIDKETEKFTGGELSNTRQRDKVLSYIRDELNFPIETYQKAYLKSLMEDKSTPKGVKKLIDFRLKSGKTSVAKYTKLVSITDKLDSRARGLLQYHVATTGRWGGRMFQPQNLTRGSFSDVDNCIRLFKLRDSDTLDMIYDDSMGALSSCVRGMICAENGKKFIIADYASIEAIVLAWIAGQEDSLKIFRGHGKIYEHTASKIYKISINEVTKDQRFIGKTATLALGFQGAFRAFQKMADTHGVKIDKKLAEQVVKDWRKANIKIILFWKNIGTCALNAIQSKGKIFSYREIKFKMKNNTLLCQLPSKRLLTYYYPRINKTLVKYDGGDFLSNTIFFEDFKYNYTKKKKTRKNENGVTEKYEWDERKELRKEGNIVNDAPWAWKPQTTYGGKLTENIVQAIARDLLAEAMLRLEKAGYSIVLHVHDEILAEVPEKFGSVKEFCEIMCELPSWAKGLPVRAEGFASKRYRK